MKFDAAITQTSPACPTIADEMQLPEGKKWLTVREAADYLGVSPGLVYKMYRRKELQGIQVASAIRIDAAFLAAYVQAALNIQSEPEPEPEAAPAPPPPIHQPKTRAKRGRRPFDFHYMRF